MKKLRFLGFGAVLISFVLFSPIIFTSCEQPASSSTTPAATTPTDPTIGMTEAQIFGAPSISNVTATGFKVSFTPNAGLKGNYAVQFSGDNGSTWTNLTTANGVATAAGLTPAKAYKARVAYTDATYGVKYSTAIDQTTGNEGLAPAPSISVDVSNTTKDSFVFTVSVVAGATYEAYVDGVKVATSASTIISVPASALSRTELKKITVRSVSSGVAIAADAAVSGMVKLDSTATNYSEQYYSAQMHLANNAISYIFEAGLITDYFDQLSLGQLQNDIAERYYFWDNDPATIDSTGSRSLIAYWEDNSTSISSYEAAIIGFFTTQKLPNYMSGSRNWLDAFSDSYSIIHEYIGKVDDEVLSAADKVVLMNLIAQVAFNTNNADLFSVVQE